MVEKVFRDLFVGEISEIEAVKRLHHVCNAKGLNPSVEFPITMLLLTENGQERLKLYEEFIMESNWLLAKVSAHQITIAGAVATFIKGIEDTTKQMLMRNS